MCIAAVAVYFSFSLVVWLKTNAFVEYMRIFKLATLFKVSEYLELEKNGYSDNYIDFIAEYYHDNFFARLVICPICLSFWLGVFSTSLLGLSGLLVSPLTLFFYLIFNKLL